MDEKPNNLVDFLIKQNEDLRRENIELREQLIRFQLQEEQAQALLEMIKEIKESEKVRNVDIDDTDTDDFFDPDDSHNADA